MKKRRIIKNKDEFGNVSFGETTELLVDIIGQIVILDFITKKDKNEIEAKKNKKNYKKFMERMYDGYGKYSKFATTENNSPQKYIELFFIEVLETKYRLSRLVRYLIDSFTWQFFYALHSHTPFEKPKKETVLFLLKKEIFHVIHDCLLKGKPFNNGEVFIIHEDFIKILLQDSYDKIFEKIEDEYNIKNRVFIKEFEEYWKDKNKDPFNTDPIHDILDELVNDDDHFYNELKESYEGDVSDLKNKSPKLYELLYTDKSDKQFIHIFKEAIQEFLNNDKDILYTIIDEIPKSKIKYPIFYTYFKPNNEQKIQLNPEIEFNFNNNIQNWRNGDVYNPIWKNLVFILDFLLNDYKLTGNDKKIVLAHRLIKLYFLKNAQKALSDVLNINETEQNEIIHNILIMLDNKNKKPEEFYNENPIKFLEQGELINMCLVYQFQKKANKEKSDEIISIIERKCEHSKKFFSPWLKARIKIFLCEKDFHLNQDEKKDIIDSYRTAYEEGMPYAGIYLCQFLFEAILVNIFFNTRNIKNLNDFYGYGYALEIFENNKQELIDHIKDFIKEDGDIRINLIDFQYSNLNPRGKIIQKNFPDMKSITELPSKAIEINNEGLKFENNNNLQKAIECFGNAILLDSAYINAYSNLGNILDKMGKNEHALIYYNIALLLDPDHEVTLLNRGLLLIEEGKFEDALIDFNRIINSNPNDSDAYLGCGNCYFNLKNYNNAIINYNQAIKINPNCSEAYWNLESISILTNDNENALKY
ncbi:MAG: tetratricopeptide repeat protein [Treponema sp.]|nr:tetratricopeptide repeat protein [Treponema sp.]MCL2273079.1 tetratricopeptide repeat protein [Treponema sp.]